MLTPLAARLPLLALGLTLAAWQTARAEPENPAPLVAQDRYAEAQELDRQGKVKEAAAAYEEAVRLGMKDFPRVHLKAAAAYARLGDYEAAAAHYSVVIDDLGLEGSCRD